MEESPTTVTEPPHRKPFRVSILSAPIYILLLFLAAAISIAWAYVHRLKQGRQERQFAEQMKMAGRLAPGLIVSAEMLVFALRESRSPKTELS